MSYQSNTSFSFLIHIKNLRVHSVNQNSSRWDRTPTLLFSLMANFDYFSTSACCRITDWPFTHSSRRLLRLSNSPTVLHDVLSPAEAMITFQNIDGSPHVSAPGLSITTLGVEPSTKRLPKSETVKQLIKPLSSVVEPLDRWLIKGWNMQPNSKVFCCQNTDQWSGKSWNPCFPWLDPNVFDYQNLTKCLPKSSPTLCQFNTFFSIIIMWCFSD